LGNNKLFVGGNPVGSSHKDISFKEDLARESKRNHKKKSGNQFSVIFMLTLAQNISVIFNLKKSHFLS